MRFKDKSVNPKRLTPELLLGMMIVGEVIKEAGAEFVITSMNDSHHGPGSLHYSGQAVDFRSHEFHEADIALDQMRSALAYHKDYDLILEGRGSPNEHFHLEYQPKA